MKNYSYTILSTWTKGEHENAICMLKELPYFLNEWQRKAMDNGKHVHELISQQRLRLTKQIKDTSIHEDKDAGINYFHVDILSKPVSLVIDVIDYKEGWILDWKITKQKIQNFDKMQLYFYAYCLSLLGINTKRAYLVAVEKNTKSEIIATQIIELKITKKSLQEAKKWAESTIREIETYMSK